LTQACIPQPDLDCYPTFHARATPEKPAIKMCATGQVVTFRELEERSNQAARVMRECNLTVGDHVAVLMDNRPEILEVCFGADRSGLYYTGISTHLTPDDISFIINDTGAKLVLVSDSFASVIEAIKPSLKLDPVCFVVGGAREGFADWKQACSGMPGTPISDETLGEDMLYSSGTTGRPKGIKRRLTGKPPGVRTPKIELLNNLFGYSRQSRYLSPAPLYHSAPLRHVMTTIKLGGTGFVMDRFDAEPALQIIEAEKITHSLWVPTMFWRLLNLPAETRQRYDVSSMEVAVHAAAPCPNDVKQEMIDWWGPIIHEYYAGTEDNGFCAITSQEWIAHKGSVGQAKSGVLHICDEDGKELPRGEEGDVYFSGGRTFTYHNNPEETAASRNKHGWTTLGDVGWMDEEGYLHLTGRKSFMIISGGVNIHPLEIENVLLSHPQVADAAVIGVPNEDFGEEVKAVVQPVNLGQADDALKEELIAYCRDRLSKLRIPRSIDFMESLPRMPMGKVLKRELVEKFRHAP